jgi:hypothetical protein
VTIPYKCHYQSEWVIKSNAEVDAWEIAPRFSELLANTGIQFFQDRVKMLHPADHLGMNGSTGSCSGGTVVLESGLLIEYDWYCFIHPLCHIFVYIQASFLSLKKKSQENGLFLCSDIVEKLI